MIDPLHFRKVLSAYPTGVCVITARDAGGGRHALVVGSFTSISLDPPLVGFFPTTTSQSWQDMRGIGRFCVNVLAAHQLEECRRFAARGADKFADLAHGESPSGQPLIDQALAWIDCAVETVHEIGDHFLVVGRVEALGRTATVDPLLFVDGQYRSVGGDAQARLAATPGT